METKGRFLLPAILLIALTAQTLCAQDLLPLKDARDAGKWGYQDNTGKVVISPKFAAVFMFSENIGIVRTVAVNDGDDHGVYGSRRDYVNIKGDVISGQIYEIDDISLFSNGYGLIGGKAAQGSEAKYFFVDANGKIASKEYDNAYSFSDGAALVEENGKWFAVDTRFAVLCEVPGSPAGNYWWSTGKEEHYNYFKNGLLAVKSSANKWGAMDKTGKIVIPQTHDKPFSFNGSYAAVYGPYDSTSKIIVIDRSGKTVYSYESDKPLWIIDHLEDGKIISYHEEIAYGENAQRLEVMLHDIVKNQVTKEIEYNGAIRWSWDGDSEEGRRANHSVDYFWAVMHSRFMYRTYPSAFWNICRKLLFEKKEKTPELQAVDTWSWFSLWYGRYFVERLHDRFIDINTFHEK